MRLQRRCANTACSCNKGCSCGKTADGRCACTCHTISIDTVQKELPVVFVWKGEAEPEGIYVLGSWDRWSMGTELHKQADADKQYSCTIFLEPGFHHYKFVVGNEWKVAVDQPTQTDATGHLNNFIKVNVSN
eukprot:TRINITY_DN3191_c0_g1_i1.p1 TRINITY_DN3191_c0_g1~~TRINITY_DN3191_c0_g1_i1.p1  ORF type:complete len:132 (+),score=25.90 TRINITY_DN3191_c0_g1_i1:115-510(+)